jgi:hypothetical protein
MVPVPATRDVPDTVFVEYLANQKAGYGTGYPVRAEYRISGQIPGLTTIFLVKYQINV